jgi:predicted lipid-binding transport protein (Tim44 family)
MGEDPPDFFGSALSIVGTVLNTLFRTQNERLWRAESVDVDSMPMITEATVGPPQPSMAQRAHDDIAVLARMDPDFNELQFLAQASVQYRTYLTADAAMSADALTSVATPEFVESFRQRVKRWSDAGLARVAHDMNILASTVLKVSLDGTRQAIVVRFSSSGVRYTKDVDTGTATDGTARSESFTEFGTFERPPGTTTPKLNSAVGNAHCPSCGAPATAGAATCAFCGTNLTGTGSSWLLDKISESAYT